MKLIQGQQYQCGENTVRITRLERLAVEYKAVPVPAPEDGTGTRHRVTKKEFCRLIKGAPLLPAGE